MTALRLPDDQAPSAADAPLRPRIGARAVCEALVREGATTIFGYPGGTVLPIYDVLREFPLRHILVRHEQGGAHAADGFSRATGGVGVAIATSGPGAINLVTGLATAMMDSRPDGRHHRQRAARAARQGRLPGDRHRRDRAAGHEVRDRGHGPRRGPAGGGRGVRDRARGRPGPVLLDFPKDVLQLETSAPASRAVRAATARPAAAGARRRAGGGRAGRDDRGRRAPADPGRPRRADRRAPSTCCARSRSAPRCRSRTRCSASGTWTRRIGCSAGYAGMHGWMHVNKAIQQCDLLIGIGCRYDDRITGKT